MNRMNPMKRVSNQSLNIGPLSNTESGGTSVDQSWDSSNGSFDRTSPEALRRRQRTLRWLRVSFVMALLGLAVAMALWTRHYLHQAEEDLATAQFASFAHHAVMTVKQTAAHKLYGARALAQVVANAVPNVTTWPFISVPGFYDIANNIVPTSMAGGLSVAPIVRPQQAADFEQFAYDFYAEQFPGEEVAVSDFGRGIFHRDCKDLYEDGHCHDVTGTVAWNTSFPNILTPKLLHSRGNHPLLLLNVHHEETKGRVVDAGVTCAITGNASHSCQAISEMVFSSKSGAGAFIVTPIKPDGITTTGFVFAKINWSECLEGLFPHDMSGIDVVIETHKDAYTYTIVQGEPVMVGEGKLHETEFQSLAKSVPLCDESLTMAEGSVRYTLTFYVSGAFDEPYHSAGHKKTAAWGAAALVIFTSLLFLLYDYLVVREHDAQQQLLEAKRQFVRFISHEVRTPLNSVVMGLTLLQEEVTKALGWDTNPPPPRPNNSSSALSSADETSTTDEESPTVTQNDQEDTSSSQHSVTYNGVDRTRVAKWHQVTQEVHANAQSSVDVLNDLLNYDKVESGTLTLELTVIPIWGLIRKTTEEFKLPAANKRVEFNLEIPTKQDDQKVVADSVRLTQVFRNLVSNAIKFTPEGGSLNVRASWTPATPKEQDKACSFKLKNGEVVTPKRSGTLHLEVQDSGAGMTKEQVTRLFRQGVQFNVNDLQAGNGSGLGLYIARGIIEQHEGTLVASSQGLGRGSTFRVSIPLFHFADNNEQPLEPEKHRSSFVEIPKQNPLNVLVVDDSSSNRRLLCRLMTNRGHTCETAENGQLALDAVRQAAADGKPFDLVLLDFEMPVLNGPQTAKALRQEGNDVFVVGITGNMLAEDVNYFSSCGANSVLPKPLKMESLEEVCMEYGIGYH